MASLGAGRVASGNEIMISILLIERDHGSCSDCGPALPRAYRGPALASGFGIADASLGRLLNATASMALITLR